MHLHIRFITGLLLIVLLASCKSTPDHTKYIPKDAALVVGINTSSLGKKIAWNAFWGSKLLDEMKKNVDKNNMMQDMEKSGIKTLSTYYAYLKSDKRYPEGKKITAIIPLDDAAKWESYLKSLKPDAVIKTQKERKELFLNNDVYASWNKEVLIVSNVIYLPVQNPFENIDYSDSAAVVNASKQMQESKKTDDAATALEMEKAFATSVDNAITTQSQFMSLAKAGHDISVWVNYEALSGEYMNPQFTGGLALSNAMWKDAAVAIGFDFEKGSINGEMQYFISDELKKVCADLGKNNTDIDLLQRLPAEQLNLLAGWNISPGTIKKIMDAMGVAGLANAGLSSTGLTVEGILDAFTGDMGLALNNFSTSAKSVPANSMYDGQEAFTTTDADIDYTIAIKIGKKDAFNKLITFAVSQGLLIQAGANSYIVPTGSDSLHVIVGDTYVVAANAVVNGNAFLNGTYKTNSKPEAANIVAKHPTGLYFDVKSVVEKMGTDVYGANRNPEFINLTKNLLSNVIFYGGENKGNTFEYHLSINFTNKDENSLIQLINYVGKMQELTKEKPVAVN